MSSNAFQQRINDSRPSGSGEFGSPPNNTDPRMQRSVRRVVRRMMRRHHTDTRLAQNILALADPRLSAAADLLADEDQLVTRVCRRMSGLLAAIPGFAGRSVSISPDTAKFRRTLIAARQQTRG